MGRGVQARLGLGEQRGDQSLSSCGGSECGAHRARPGPCRVAVGPEGVGGSGPRVGGVTARHGTVVVGAGEPGSVGVAEATDRAVAGPAGPRHPALDGGLLSLGSENRLPEPQTRSPRLLPE